MRLLAKMAEKYAKSTNTACMILWWGHQPKMPASLIKKDLFLKKQKFLNIKINSKKKASI